MFSRFDLDSLPHSVKRTVVRQRHLSICIFCMIVKHITLESRDTTASIRKDVPCGSDCSRRPKTSSEASSLFFGTAELYQLLFLAFCAWRGRTSPAFVRLKLQRILHGTVNQFRTCLLRRVAIDSVVGKRNPKYWLLLSFSLCGLAEYRGVRRQQGGDR